MAGWNTLVQADVLAMALTRADVVIADCRFSLLDPSRGQSDWQTAHIPGAIYVHLERDLSDMNRYGHGRHPWPTEAAFVAKLGQWGIAPTTQVIAYDDDNGAFAARLWALLRLLGHEKVAVLDGGWKRWVAHGLPTTAQQRAPMTARYQGSFDASRLVDADAVELNLEAGGLLLDARAHERFRGDEEPIDRAAGHVPGAMNRPFMQNMGPDGRFKSPIQLASEFRELLDGRDASDATMMCGSGVTACHNLLAMERAGLKNAKLYSDSWSGWISDPSHPIATGD